MSKYGHLYSAANPSPSMHGLRFSRDGYSLTTGRWSTPKRKAWEDPWVTDVGAWVEYQGETWQVWAEAAPKGRRVWLANGERFVEVEARYLRLVAGRTREAIESPALVA